MQRSQLQSQILERLVDMPCTNEPRDPVLDEHVQDNALRSLKTNRFAWQPHRLNRSDRGAVATRLNELECDPVAILAAMAQGIDPMTGMDAVRTKTIKDSKGNVTTQEEPAISMELRAFCAKELAQYVHPKLKSVEHSVDDENGKKIHVVMIGSVMDRSKSRREENKLLEAVVNQKPQGE